MHTILNSSSISRLRCTVVLLSLFITTWWPLKRIKGIGEKQDKDGSKIRVTEESKGVDAKGLE